ncbi:DUF2497 domain-containing protein [Reyranella sp.]|uniref:DUF2497 domain-containing protein n=1 Tax=Reyranella sp. TaxID=1929291 RepID=UPI003BAA4D9E
MADSKSSDPSMDDILASIRKIISDDEARVQSGGRPSAGLSDASVPGGSPTGSQSGRPIATPPVEPSLSGKPRDDVLLLTDIIEEPRVEAPPPPPIPLRRIDPAEAAEMAQPPVDEPAPATSGRMAGGPSLLDGIAAASTASAFAKLSLAVEETMPTPDASEPGPAIGGSGKTVEDLVKEMLRPMLKEWLDRNLPQIVERHVEREIARLTRR